MQKGLDMYRFTDNLLAMNDNKEFEDSFREIYPAELELRKENAKDNLATLLDLNITIKKEKQFLLNYLIKGMNLIFQ